MAGEERIQRRRTVFRGRVQGVGFRWTAKTVADASGSAGRPVTGTVRNEPDGSVSLELQGRGEHIEAALSELREKMRGNILEEASSAVPTRPGEKGFDIER